MLYCSAYDKAVRLGVAITTPCAKNFLDVVGRVIIMGIISRRGYVWGRPLTYWVGKIP